MGKNYRDRLMASQSMARVSSASTETDYIPATVPFEWEAAPGKPAAHAEREVVDEAPSLPLPPGRRAKDGFFLPIPRPRDADTRGIDSSPHTERRRPFKLRFPSSSSRQLTVFQSRKARKLREDADTGSIINPLSGHRFGSRVTRRVLVESRKSPSSWFGQCLLRKGASSHVEHIHKGRGLDDSDRDEEHYVTPASGSPLSGSPRHGHEAQTRNSSEAGARVPTNSRFNMASMLLSLCPSESEEESDQAEAVDGGNEITDDYGDEVGMSEHLITPSFGSSGKLQQARPGTKDFTTTESDQRCTVVDCKGNNVTDAHSVSASPDRESRLWPTTKGSRQQSTLSWKPSDQMRVQLDPLATFVTANAAQEPGESGSAKEMSEEVAGDEEIGSCSSLERNFSVRRSNCSSPLHKSGSNHPSTSTSKSAVLPGMVESLATPRSSCGSSDYSFITTCSIDNNYAKAEVDRGRSTSCSATTPTADEPSLLERNFSRERLEPNQSPATKPISSIPPLSLLLNQARLHVTTPKAKIIFKDKKVPSNSPAWLEELKSSSLWPSRAPKRAPKTSTHDDAGNGDSGVESGEEFENSSMESFEYGTPRAGLSIPSPSSPVSCNLPKPATWVVSEEVLQSSSLLKCKLQRQQSHEWPRSSFMSDQETTSTAFEQIDVTAPKVLLPCASDECQQANSPDHGSKGENLADRLSETSKSSSGMMSKAAQGESKAGVGSSRKLLPIYLHRRGSTIVTGKAVSSGDESGDDFENSSTDSSENGTPRAVPLVFCKFTTSLESEAWVSEEVSEEVLKSSSLLKCKLQRQLRSMGLQTNSIHGANHFENSSTDLIEHGTPRAVSPKPSSNSPVFCKFIISLEPEAWVVSKEGSEEVPSRSPTLWK